ncbi:MAG: YeiH family protein [Elusimicrobiota bacterium]
MNPSIAIFLGLFVFAFTPFASPPTALVLGIAYALVFSQPFPNRVRPVMKALLQTSIVGLGFGMNLRSVFAAGADGLAYTVIGISFALTAGWALGRLFRVEGKISYLVSVGTAICGGSAIAAIGPVMEAEHEQMSVALGAVFLLNSAALLIFPPIGRMLGLTQPQFGLWAALAIHDTSSVVGACLKYGPGALAVGVTVKLARALWIVPVCAVTAGFRRSCAKIQWPWFIAFFVMAAALNTFAPGAISVWHVFDAAGKAGLTAALFLIGAGLSPAAIRRVGARPMLQALALWILVGSLSLLAILHRLYVPGRLILPSGKI